MNLIQTLEAENIAKFNEAKSIPDFRPGDTLRVGVRVVAPHGEAARRDRDQRPTRVDALARPGRRRNRDQ